MGPKSKDNNGDIIKKLINIYKSDLEPSIAGLHQGPLYCPSSNAGPLRTLGSLSYQTLVLIKVATLQSIKQNKNIILSLKSYP